MEKRIIARYIRITPKKLRMVVGQFKNKNAQETLVRAKLYSKRGAKFLHNVVKSGVHQFSVQEQPTVVIKNIIINEGPRFKRWRAGSRGMGKRYQKRTSHLEVILGTPNTQGK